MEGENREGEEEKEENFRSSVRRLRMQSSNSLEASIRLGPFI